MPRILALITPLLLALTTPLAAGTFVEEDSSTLYLTIDPIQRMTFDSSLVSFPTPTADDLDAGFLTYENALNIHLWSNVKWRLMVKTTDPDMGTVGDFTKPVHHMQWRAHGTGTYTALRHQNDRIDRGNGFAEDYEIPLDLRVRMRWNRDRPGTYGVTLTFTLGTEA